MTLEQLRIFVAVAEREHVTRAAEALNLTQSATSAAVAALENRHATALFDRIGRRIRLTEAGRAFLVEARGVLARAAAAEQLLFDLANLKTGTLRLAASQTVANYWLPPRMARFHVAHPGIALPLMIGNTEQVAHQVAEGSVDIGFVEGDVDDPSLLAEVVGADELVVVAAPGHPFHGRSKIAWAELPAGPWILREPGSGTRAMFEQALRRAGVDPQRLAVALELPSNEAVLAAVRAGAGATAISRLAAAAALDAGEVSAVELGLPARSFSMVRLAGRQPTSAETAFRALLGPPSISPAAA